MNPNPWLQLPTARWQGGLPGTLAGGSEEPFQLDRGAAAPHGAGHMVSIGSLFIRRQTARWQRREASQLTRVQRRWPNTLLPAAALCKGRRGFRVS